MTKHRYRSHTCAQLRKSDAGHDVRLSGWVHRVRDHGGLLFIDLRDHYGMTQIVADPDSPAFKTAEAVRGEWVIRIDGAVKARSPETVNPNLPTGEIEVFAREIEVLSAAKELPLPVFGEPDYPEDIRLKYRFLDLRRETLHKNIVARTKIISEMRRRMAEASFTEFSTPILTASSPEGARDFLVPSRIHPGKFYALPQAPQQYKQLIMVSGFDRYFQIAPCFRDEDPRADRLPGEFYQLDLEMSFVEQDDVLGTMEPVLRSVFETFAEGKPVTQKFPKIGWGASMRAFGTDKPDLRNPLLIANVSDVFRGSGFGIFARMLEQNDKTEIWAIPAPKGGSRAFCDRMDSWAKAQGQPGLAYIFWRDENGEQVAAGPVAKNLGEDRTANVREFITAEHSPWAKIPAPQELFTGLPKEFRDRYLDIRPEGFVAGDAVFFVAGVPKDMAAFAAQVRNRVADELSLAKQDCFELCWIVDFPFFEWNEDEKKIDFAHNPFSMPQGGMGALTGTDNPLEIVAYQYDMVCNGFEIASGGIRNHLPETMVKAFEMVGLDRATVEERFGGLYRAFQYGAPPHGGMAAGVDRIVMLLLGAKNLREITMFPMNQQAVDLLMNAPSEGTPTQMRELHLRTVMPQK